ncbi:hypothetical protein NEOLEDRAFT_1184314 [Neolentinus lepideus HHB14362 ss-1]|uniref:Uncharacterized protein n=1 Tax=Neolentinus lepideus HHB14362 ss-1 TaxID=1314782 RepID=A0A165MJS8_9AGAM|nr:hypothetical protein NEOLEDRAFT_1184314 [Neolentinus lepideus HHB14362 ss-1]
MTILHHPVSTYIYRSVPLLSSDIPVEEDYNPHHFYPVRLGEVFQDSYEVIAELVYGSNSTVWLACDLLWYVPHIYILSLLSTPSNQTAVALLALPPQQRLPTHVAQDGGVHVVCTGLLAYGVSDHSHWFVLPFPASLTH